MRSWNGFSGFLLFNECVYTSAILRKKRILRTNFELQHPRNSTVSVAWIYRKWNTKQQDLTIWHIKSNFIMQNLNLVITNVVLNSASCVALDVKLTSNIDQYLDTRTKYKSENYRIYLTMTFTVIKFSSLESLGQICQDISSCNWNNVYI